MLALAVAGTGRAAPPGGDTDARFPTLSDDGILLTAEGALWRVPLRGGDALKVTSKPGEASHPVVSPDGTRVAFSATFEGPMEVYVMALETGAVSRRLTYEGEQVFRAPVAPTKTGRVSPTPDSRSRTSSTIPRMLARPRLLVGLVGSVAMLLSVIPHTLLGWPAQRRILEVARVPAEAILGLQVAWQFGGMAIVTFALIALIAFVQVLRGHAPHMRAARLVGLAYTAFGVWAWLLTREPFALVFIVPGLMVLTGATGKG